MKYVLIVFIIGVLAAFLSCTNNDRFRSTGGSGEFRTDFGSNHPKDNENDSEDDESECNCDHSHDHNHDHSNNDDSDRDSDSDSNDENSHISLCHKNNVNLNLPYYSATNHLRHHKNDYLGNCQ